MNIDCPYCRRTIRKRRLTGTAHFCVSFIARQYIDKCTASGMTRDEIDASLRRVADNQRRRRRREAWL